MRVILVLEISGFRSYFYNLCILIYILYFSGIKHKFLGLDNRPLVSFNIQSEEKQWCTNELCLDSKLFSFVMFWRTGPNQKGANVLCQLAQSCRGTVVIFNNLEKLRNICIKEEFILTKEQRLHILWGKMAIFKGY